MVTFFSLSTNHLTTTSQKLNLFLSRELPVCLYGTRYSINVFCIIPDIISISVISHLNTDIYISVLYII